MNEKGKRIIEAAIKLFAKKGYHATSMQEIADTSGVSKGSVYNHFDSKENLMLSIFKYYYELVVEKITLVSEDDSLSPKEKLVKQIHLQFEEFLGHRNFIEMQMREKAVQVNDEITSFMFQIRSETMEWYKNQVIGIYGDRVGRYEYDLATILHAMINEYMGYLIIDKMELDLLVLSRFIVERLDDLVEGLAEKQPAPIITGGISAEKPRPFEEVHEEIARIREMAETFSNRNDVLDSAAVLEKELASEQPKKVLVQGMLAFLRSAGDAELAKQVEKISAMLPF